MVEVPFCIFKVGNRVILKPEHRYVNEWRGELIITGIHWDYQKGEGMNISLASVNEIEHKDGDTDGWSPDDLILVGKDDG